MAVLTSVGSFLFHTTAQVWSMWSDILPILFLMLSFFGFVLLFVFGWKGWAVASSLLAFTAVGFILQNEAIYEGLPFGSLNGSLGYVHAWLALLAIAYWPISETGRKTFSHSMWWALFVFSVSLFFRSIDNSLCEAWPFGTHFIWHTLNGFLIFLLIRAMVRLGPNR